MSTNLDVASGASAANTTYLTMFTDAFNNVLPGPWSMWTQQIPGVTGKVDIEWVSNIPVMKKWEQARTYKTPRQYALTLIPIWFESTMPIDIDLINTDKTGMVGRMMSTFLQRGASVYDQYTASILDGSSGAGPTGYDAVALFATNHPYVGSTSGTGSNLAASTAFTHTNVTSAIATMQAWRDEQGENLMVSPNVCRVGPLQRRKAREIFDANNVVKFYDTTTAETSSALVQAAPIDNVYQGECTVVVDTRIGNISGQGYYWDLMDLTKGESKPMVVADEVAVYPTIIDDPQNEHVFEHREFVYGLQAKFNVTAGVWFTAYRGTPTS